MGNVTSYEIKEALSRKHGNREFFITECKNGPTGVATGQLLQFDAVAIYKSWTTPQIRGYEIKVSRGDFLRDAKYSRYLPYFHEFYFVVPQGMVQRQELDEGIGLIWYNQDTGTLTTKKRAVYRRIEPNVEFLLYIIMTRLESDRAPFMLHRDEAFRAWFAGKESNRELAYKVKSKLIAEIVRLEKEVFELTLYGKKADELTRLKSVMAKHGISSHWGTSAEERLDEALTRKYPMELDRILSSAKQVVSDIDRLKFQLEKEAANET